ncbi:MAG: DUF6048 family protein [Paludibacteraceae bacterium]|nr:DUF6048 family protein [Paludibacteraceae bacterium]
MRRLLTILLTFVCCSLFAQQDSLQSFSDSVLTAQRSFSDSDLSGEAGLSAAGVQRLKDGTRVYADSAIYQGMNIHLDLFTPILELARSKGKVQSYEIGMSWRLKQRLYPTLELGYARAELDAEGAHHNGQGGFFRAGIDLNGLKKRPERLNALLVGIRIGTAVQDYQLTNVQVVSPYWDGGVPYRFDMPHKIGADCWGEVVLGCQVQVWEGFQMGWNFRLKILMTRKAKDGGGLPAYIPGFGYRDDTNWGINYYIGYHF